MASTVSPIEVRAGAIVFKSAVLEGTRTMSATFNFTTHVKNATAVITGFSTGFNENVVLSDIPEFL